MARKATIEIDAQTAEARASLEGLEESLEDVSIEARQADQSVGTVGGADAAASMSTASAAAEGLSESLDDVDGSGHRSRGSLTELAGEAGEVIEVLGALSTQGKAVVGVLAGGAATVGAGLGLAGAATLLASKLGSQGLQRDIKNVVAEAKAAGRSLSIDFAGVIQNDVLPVTRNFISEIEDLGPSLANFSSGTFDFFQGFERAGRQGVPSVFEDPLGAITGGLQKGGALALTEGIPGLLSEAGVLPEAVGGTPFGFFTDLITPDQGAGSTGTGATDRALQKIEKLRRKKDKVVGAQKTLIRFGRKRTKALKTQIGAVEKAQTAAANFLQTVENPEAERTVLNFIRDLNSELEVLRRRKDILQTTAQALNRIRTPFGQGGSPAVQGRGPSRIATGIESTLSGTIGAGQLAPAQIERGAKQAGNEIDRSINRNLTTGIRLAGQLGATLSRAAQKGGAEFEQVFAAILQSAGGFLTAIAPTTGGLSAIPGATLSAVGGIVGTFQSGGEVDTPFQIVGERGPELVSMPQGTRVHSNSETRAMMDTSALEQKVDRLTRVLQEKPTGVREAEIFRGFENEQSRLDKMVPAPS